MVAAYDCLPPCAVGTLAWFRLSAIALNDSPRAPEADTARLLPRERLLRALTDQPSLEPA
jgi:hypothetical protein